MPILKKDNVLTLSLFGLPLAQRKMFLTATPHGGGEAIRDFEFRICGLRCYKSFGYKKIERGGAPALSQNHLLAPSLLAMSDTELIEKTNALCSRLDSQSQETIHQIISRTKAASYCPCNKFFSLEQNEIEALRKLEEDFFSKLCKSDTSSSSFGDYLLPIPHLEASVFHYKHGLDTFAPQTLEEIKSLDIIDVGGFIGDSALVMQDYTDKNIYSFEATTLNYNLMLQTIALNNTTRIIPVKKALGASESKLIITLCGSASSMLESSKSIYGDQESEEVEIITLDSYVKEHNLKVGFIKVDIEGFEMEFLKGAKETICSQKPAMLISIYHQASDFFDIKPMLESWDLGYRFHIHKPIDGNISAETTLMCQVL